MSNAPSVCVLGSLNADHVVRAERLPRPGETLLGGPYEIHPGGKGANQAVAAARAGVPVRMIGAIGQDPSGELLAETLRASGVEVGGLERLSDVPTGVAVITVAEGDGENTIVVAPGANACVTTAMVDACRDAIRSARVLVAQLETPVEAFEAAARIARESGTRVILNAAPAQRLPASVCELIDVLVVNQVEAETLLGGATDEASAAERLASMIGGACVITLGSAGAIVSDGNAGITRCDATPVDALVDTVGAGDAFVGMLAASLARDASWSRTLSLSCAAGALAVTVRGAIPSLPDWAAVVALCDGA